MRSLTELHQNCKIILEPVFLVNYCLLSNQINQILLTTSFIFTRPVTNNTISVFNCPVQATSIESESGA